MSARGWRVVASVRVPSGGLASGMVGVWVEANEVVGELVAEKELKEKQVEFGY